MAALRAPEALVGEESLGRSKDDAAPPQPPQAIPLMRSMSAPGPSPSAGGAPPELAAGSAGGGGGGRSPALHRPQFTAAPSPASRCAPSLELQEAEAAVFAHLELCVALAATPFGLAHLGGRPALHALLPLVKHGTARVRRLALALLLRLAGRLEPADLAHALPEAAVQNTQRPSGSTTSSKPAHASPARRGGASAPDGLVPWLLGMVGRSAMASSGGSSSRSSSGGDHGGKDFGDDDEGAREDVGAFSGAAAAATSGGGGGVGGGLGGAYLELAHAHDVVAFLHALLAASPSAVAPLVVPCLRTTLGNACRQLAADGSACRDAGGLAACLALLGGLQPLVRVGGLAAVEASSGALSRAASKAGAPAAVGMPGRVVASVVALDRDRGTASVAFEGAAGASAGPFPLKLEAMVPLGTALPPCLLGNDELCGLFMRTFKLLKRGLDKALGSAGLGPGASGTGIALRGAAGDDGSDYDDDDDDDEEGAAVSMASLAAGVR